MVFAYCLALRKLLISLETVKPDSKMGLKFNVAFMLTCLTVSLGLCGLASIERGRVAPVSGGSVGAVGLGAWGWVMRSLVSVLLLQWAWYRIASNKRKSPALWLGF